MATYTIKIDKRNKAAKAFIEMIQALPFIEIIESKPEISTPKKESHYNPEFVKKIKKAQKEKGGIIVTADNLWESLK